MDRPESSADRFGDVHEGSDVYSADDQKIGTISEIHDKFLVAHKGFFFPKDLYIPSDVIDRVENDRVYVNVDKDYVNDQHWEAAPGAMRDDGAAPTAQAVRDRIPDAIGTPDTTGTIEEGGREVRAGDAGSRERQIDYGRAMGHTADQPTETFGQPAEAKVGTIAGSDVTASSDATSRGSMPATSTRSRWETVMPEYRSRWQQRSGTGGGTWEDVEPSYRYGWDMANDPHYQGRRWEDVQPDLQRDWGTRYPATPWDRASQAVRDAWDSVTNRR